MYLIFLILILIIPPYLVAFRSHQEDETWLARILDTIIMFILMGLIGTLLTTAWKTWIQWAH